jgi:parvulin-like peptidyl-prolyl isomerase
MRSFSQLLSTLGLGLLGLLGPAQAQPDQPATPEAQVKASEPVIVVGEHSVTLTEFEAVVRQAMRQKFYHGKVPEAEIQSLLQETADQIVNDTLLVDEATRRGMKPSKQKIDQALAGYDERYGSNPNWKQNRAAMLGRLVPEMERRDLLDQIDQAARDVAPAPDSEVRAFYEARKDLFTEPEKLKLSLILLLVDPSSGSAVWDKAMEEGKAIHKRLKAGGDFAEAARLHSGDESAARGGDLGYVHRGMLPEALQAKIDGFKVGEIQEPMVVLQGVAIIRVDDRTAPRVRAFEDVKSRAAELHKRERGDVARKDLITKLRGQAKFAIRKEQFGEIVGRLK